MSTKIYDAYEFKGSLPALTKYLLELRVKVIDRAVEDAKKNDTLNRTTCAGGISMYDLARALERTAAGNEFFEVDKEHKWLVQNLKSSAVIYPVGKRLFVQFFGLPRGVEVKDKRFVDYHYQNQTDPWYDYEEWERKEKGLKPRGKTWLKKQAANYRERRRMWDRIFPRYEAPAQVGLCHDFIVGSDFLTVAQRIIDNIHGHKFMGQEVEKARACSLCNMAKKGIEPEPEEVAS